MENFINVDLQEQKYVYSIQFFSKNNMITSNFHMSFNGFKDENGNCNGCVKINVYSNEKIIYNVLCDFSFNNFKETSLENISFDELKNTKDLCTHYFVLPKDLIEDNKDLTFEITYYGNIVYKGIKEKNFYIYLDELLGISPLGVIEPRSNYRYYIVNRDTDRTDRTVLNWFYIGTWDFCRYFDDGRIEYMNTRSWSIGNEEVLEPEYWTNGVMQARNVNATGRDITTNLVANGVLNGGSDKFYHSIDCNTYKPKLIFKEDGIFSITSKTLNMDEVEGTDTLYCTAPTDNDNDIGVTFTLSPSNPNFCFFSTNGTKNSFTIKNDNWGDKDEVLSIRAYPINSSNANPSDWLKVTCLYADATIMYLNGKDGGNIGSIMSHQSLFIEATYDFYPSNWTPVGHLKISKDSTQKARLINLGNNTWNLVYNSQTLTEDITIELYGWTYQKHGGKMQTYVTVTIKPSLTGIQINKTSSILNYENNYQDVITAIPLPIGTGAPVSYSWISQDNNIVQCLNNTSNTVTLDGQHSNKDIVPVTVTASLVGGSLSFSTKCDVLVKPNMRIFTEQFHDGQPYVYDNGSFNEAAEIYIYDGTKFNKDRVN